MKTLTFLLNNLLIATLCIFSRFLEEESIIKIRDYLSNFHIVNYRHLDHHKLWDPNEFAVHCFKIIMYSIQVSNFGSVLIQRYRTL